MATLLGRHQLGHRVQNYWKHVGDDGRDRITVETVEDVAPVFKSVKMAVEAEKSKPTFKLKAQIPYTVIDETAKVSAELWGVTVKEAFEEIIQQKTDRAERVMRLLTEGRDYNKFHAKTYR